MAKAIGIDLGTTYTVAAYIQDGHPRVIPNAEGERLTPSAVALTGDGTLLVGQAAKAQAAANPRGTVFSVKRLMGSGRKVRLLGEQYAPQEVSSLILRKVKDDAESFLDEKVESAVITVPAYFNDPQRLATREAGRLAGLEVLRIINEPTAAALAYGLEREDVHTILVWDLGGGTFDISILDLGEGIFEVRAVGGDTWLGGDDIDTRVMDHLAQEYRKTAGADFPGDPGLRQRLREAAEGAKIALSFSPVARVPIPAPDTQKTGNLELGLSREQLEDLIPDLLQRMATIARRSLADAQLTAAQIDRVVLVGGATRMPAVRNLVRKLFDKEPYRYVDPDEVVAQGAAIQAGMLTGQVEKAALLDVLPLSLGVETQGGLTAKIIHRNTPLPASASRMFTTAADYQTSMDMHVLQGERELALDNVSLGRFQLDDIPPGQRGFPRIEVVFQADSDGIISVSATELRSESSMEVKLASTKLLDPWEIGHLVDEAARSDAQDRETRARVEACIEAENLIAAAQMVLDQLTERPRSSAANQVTRACSELKEALACGTTEEVRSRGADVRCLLAKVSSHVLTSV